MISVKDCFRPQRNTMADFVELTPESIHHEALQRHDRAKPYDIFGQGGEGWRELPECLTVMDKLIDMGEEMK